MSDRYIRLFLTTGTRIRKLETDKTYVIKNFKENVFIPKICCKLQELQNNDHSYRWALDIPIWLCVKNEQVSDAITYIQDLNEWRETKMKDQIEEGLDIINKYLNDG